VINSVYLLLFLAVLNKKLQADLAKFSGKVRPDPTYRW